MKSSVIQTPTPAERLAASIRKTIEDDVYAAIARRMLCYSIWSDRDVLQTLKDLGYSPPFCRAEVMGAYSGYKLPDGTPGGDVLVYWSADDHGDPSEIHVHIWDERGVCIDDNSRMVEHVREWIWDETIQPAYDAIGPACEERIQARNHGEASI